MNMIIQSLKKIKNNLSDAIATAVDLLRGNLLYMIFIFILTIIYITTGHLNDNLVRNINKNNIRLTEAKYKYKNLNMEVISKGDVSRIEEAANVLGLKYPTKAPYAIK